MEEWMTSKKLVATVAVGLAVAPGLVVYGATTAASAKSTAHIAASASAGKAVFASKCATCHGSAGQGAPGRAPAYKTLPRAKTTKGVLEQLAKPINTTGCKCMPTGAALHLSKTEEENVAAYVVTIHTA
jgi:mono/diheme cytochrome c family protein